MTTVQSFVFQPEKPFFWNCWAQESTQSSPTEFLRFCWLQSFVWPADQKPI